jgi:transcriptional regulator with PAS, ATPase and Fis domain
VDVATIPRYLVEEGPAGNRNLPVRLGKTPDQAERELIYRGILDIKQELADLKARLDSSPAPAKAPRQTLESMEREMIRNALEEFHYNKKKAAQKLGIGERTIYRKIRKYGLE